MFDKRFNDGLVRCGRHGQFGLGALGCANRGGTPSFRRALDSFGEHGKVVEAWCRYSNELRWCGEGVPVASAYAMARQRGHLRPLELLLYFNRPGHLKTSQIIRLLPRPQIVLWIRCGLQQFGHAPQWPCSDDTQPPALELGIWGRIYGSECLSAANGRPGGCPSHSHCSLALPRTVAQRLNDTPQKCYGSSTPFCQRRCAWTMSGCCVFTGSS